MRDYRKEFKIGLICITISALTVSPFLGFKYLHSRQQQRYTTPHSQIQEVNDVNSIYSNQRTVNIGDLEKIAFK